MFFFFLNIYWTFTNFDTIIYMLHICWNIFKHNAYFRIKSICVILWKLHSDQFFFLFSNTQLIATKKQRKKKHFILNFIYHLLISMYLFNSILFIYIVLCISFILCKIRFSVGIENIFFPYNNWLLKNNFILQSNKIRLNIIIF